MMVRGVDNGVYDRLGGSWWDETSLLNVLHGSVTPGRFAYFRDVLARQFGAGAAGLRVLDIGCGGGFLAEEFAALGCRVTGVDPSPASINAARAHGAGRGLLIDYRVGVGEELPVPDAAFGVACCCDVLEHVSDVDRVISETARVLEPGGLYLFDTINRTRTSKLLAIKAAQQWRLTRLTDVAFHDWDMFITPAELAAAGVDLANIDAVLYQGEDEVARGNTSAVLGNPTACVAWLARKVAGFGVKLEAGHLILPGSCTRAIDARPGDAFRAEFAGLGTVTTSFS